MRLSGCFYLLHLVTGPSRRRQLRRKCLAAHKNQEKSHLRPLGVGEPPAPALGPGTGRRHGSGQGQALLPGPPSSVVGGGAAAVPSACFLRSYPNFSLKLRVCPASRCTDAASVLASRARGRFVWQRGAGAPGLLAFSFPCKIN